MLWALIVVCVLLVLVALSNWALQKRLRQLTEEVEHLRSGQDVATRVAYLVHHNRTPEAMQIYAKATGMTLREAKVAVEIIAKNNPEI